MRKFVLAFNTLLINRKRSMLTEITSHIKIFFTDICDLFIEKLEEFEKDLEDLVKKAGAPATG